ncbi:ATP-binding protein [Streptomyces sp. SDr-06]|uniref:ATP-binding protein n=1 Tax=Streptomyces sp. SDr-06 TaxID=2267702 RepID=UPI001CB991F4|nr:ATP-binding protein [Streptomyces sp. SDr-06]
MASVQERGLVEDGGEAPGAWPLHVGAALDGDGACIAQARHLAAEFLVRARDEYGVVVSQRAQDLACLVVSELVTNALKYAPGPVLLDLNIEDETVEIAVWDSDPVLPIARAADADRVGQHGLEIVLTVASSFEARKETVGKRITVGIALGDVPRPLRHAPS